MNRTSRIVACIVALCLLFSSSALAQTVRVTGQKCTLPVWRHIVPAEGDVDQQDQGAQEEQTGEPGLLDGFECTEMTVLKLKLLGIVEEKWVAAIVNNQYFGFIAKRDLQYTLQRLDISELPLAESVETMARKSRGDAVVELQTKLLNMGYLAYGVDGDFGGMTENALISFQTEKGLPVNGKADAQTLWMLDYHVALQQGVEESSLEVAYPSVYTVEEKFAPILEEAECDLAPFLTPDYQLNYDIYRRQGSIDVLFTVGQCAVEEPQIDRISILAEPQILLSRNAADRLEMQPVLKLESAGATRMYIDGVYVQVGDKAYELPLIETHNSLSGIQLVETTLVGLTSIAAEQLLAMDSAEFQVVVIGQNGKYHLDAVIALEDLQSCLQAMEASGIAFAK